MATLCGSFQLVGLLLSRENDENLGELLNIGRITTFVTDTEPSRIGAAHVPLPVSFGAHTHRLLEERPSSWGGTRSELIADHQGVKITNLDTDQDTPAACK